LVRLKPNVTTPERSTAMGYNNPDYLKNLLQKHLDRKFSKYNINPDDFIKKYPAPPNVYAKPNTAEVKKARNWTVHIRFNHVWRVNEIRELATKYSLICTAAPVPLPKKHEDDETIWMLNIYNVHDSIVDEFMCECSELPIVIDKPFADLQ
jgi:hypothetical protein